MQLGNRMLVLVSRPGDVVEDENFQLLEGPIPQPSESQILVRNLWLSFDPSLRGRLLEPRPYMKTVQIGEVMQA